MMAQPRSYQHHIIMMAHLPHALKLNEELAGYKDFFADADIDFLEPRNNYAWNIRQEFMNVRDDQHLDFINPDSRYNDTQQSGR